MTKSESPSLVFLNTSFTMRDRFTPARACSTLTRMRANFRFLCFSASVSFPRGGFFFRLAGFLYCWLIPLKGCVLVQHRPRRIGNALLVSDLLVVRLADVGLTQELDAWTVDASDHHVLVGMRLLLSAVVRGLFFWVFRPLATPFRAIKDELAILIGRQLGLGKAIGIPLGEGSQRLEGALQDWQQPVDPRVDAGLTQAKEFRHDGLQGISF